MQTHLELELEQIKLKIFKMMDLTIEAIQNSITALKEHDINLAKAVIINDTVIDEIEMLIDDECIRLLVTKQPAAIDLRLVLSIMKINTDIERIGDLTSNIAVHIADLKEECNNTLKHELAKMAEYSISMMKDSITSFTNKDVKLAHKVIARDKKIDSLNKKINSDLFKFTTVNKKGVYQKFNLMMISKSFERIGDHIKNIAERSIYYIEGIDIRHDHTGE